MTESIAFDRIAERYDATRGGTARGTHAAGFLMPWLADTGPVLEVGVGTGVVASALAGQGQRVFGVDLSLPMLRHARERLGPRVVAGDALLLPIRDASVAGVYFVHVLHLVADISATLAEAHRVLATGGRLLVICTDVTALAHEVADIMTRLQRAIVGERPDHPDRVLALAAQQGFSLLHRERLAFSSQWSVAEVISSLEQRTWAWTWDIDDDTWAAHVEPALDQLRTIANPTALQDGEDFRTLLVFGLETSP